jgi:hypothetical protein
MGRNWRAKLRAALRGSMALATVLGAAAVGAVGCAPSEEEIQEAFDDYVEGANACSVASECAIAEPGCPLGCSVAVRADRVESVERKARELIDDYQSGGQGCVYTCLAPGELECARGRCALSWQ